jgi:acetylornithine deacetylase/succinyl-diaminopimelate desuccinylase-like protein
MLRIFLIAFLIVSLYPCCAQSSIEIKNKNHYLNHGMNLLIELLKIPNDSHKKDQIMDNLIWCEQVLSDRGFNTERLDTESFPLLLATAGNKASQKTILFYFHMDGQPADATKWKQNDPYQPVFRYQNENDEWIDADRPEQISEYHDDWRIFARSASDDKGPFAMFLAAWDAIADEGLSPDYQVKIILDFEEEIGSPNLPQAVEKHKFALKSDLMLIMDGPRHLSNLPTIAYGARGIASLTLEVFGPVNAQHSGHYGNYAPNPALLLSQLLASMKSADGKVLISGYYDGIILTEMDKKILSEVPDDDEKINQNLGIHKSHMVGNTYQESLQYPSLNIRGLASGWVGKEARTIVPSNAVAEIDIRLVPESDPERLFSLLKDHIVKEGFYLTEVTPDILLRMKHEKIVKWTSNIDYNAFRTPMDSYESSWIRSVYNKTYGVEPINIRIMGGSLPIAPFVEKLGVIAIILPTVNADNNQHGPDENLRIGNFREGILLCRALLNEKF